MSESLDDIKTEKTGAAAPEQPAKSGRGGARPGAGRPSTKTKASPPPPAAEPMDPEVQAMLDDAIQNIPAILSGAASLALIKADPARPPTDFEVQAMATTAKPVVLKYVGSAGSSLGIEGVFALVWFSILGARWWGRGKVPSVDPAKQGEAHSDRGSVGVGEVNAGVPTGFAAELSSLARSGPDPR